MCGPGVCNERFAGGLSNRQSTICSSARCYVPVLFACHIGCHSTEDDLSSRSGSKRHSPVELLCMCFVHVCFYRHLIHVIQFFPV